MRHIRNHTQGRLRGDDTIDGLLAATNPVLEERLQSADVAIALDSVAQLVLDIPRPRSVRRYRRGGIALAFALVLLVVATASFARMLTTHTGFFPSKAGTENDKSEFLRTDAPDFPPLVRKLVKDIPFPPGVSAAARVDEYVKQRQPGPDGIPETVQAAGIKGTFSLWAVCEWRGYWLSQHAAHDSANEAVGARGLAEVASSPALKKVDSFWPIYLGVARREAAGDASAPPRFESFYRVECQGAGQSPTAK
jgi:hypothetical protein